MTSELRSGRLVSVRKASIRCQQDLEWSDLILVMEQKHKVRLLDIVAALSKVADMVEMLTVTTPGDIGSVAELAHAIWNQHYVPIIGQAQTDYMLAKFQNASAIAQQISAGYQYYLVMADGVQAGYFAIVPNQTDHTALLSKIYVSRDRRGTGLGKAIMTFVEARCNEMDIWELWLTVNRHNADSIAFYRHVGFAVLEDVVQDIGNGFVMVDYKMVKTLRESRHEMTP